MVRLRLQLSWLQEISLDDLLVGDFTYLELKQKFDILLGAIPKGKMLYFMLDGLDQLDNAKPRHQTLA